jgi:hypothetical protein
MSALPPKADIKRVLAGVPISRRHREDHRFGFQIEDGCRIEGVHILADDNLVGGIWERPSVMKLVRRAERVTRDRLGEIAQLLQSRMRKHQWVGIHVSVLSDCVRFLL